MRRQLDMESIDQTKKGTMAVFGLLDVSSDDGLYAGYRPASPPQLSQASLPRSHDLLAYCALIERTPVHPLQTERPDRNWTASTAESITRHTFWWFLESHTFQ